MSNSFSFVKAQVQRKNRCHRPEPRFGVEQGDPIHDH